MKILIRNVIQFVVFIVEKWEVEVAFFCSAAYLTCVHLCKNKNK